MTTLIPKFDLKNGVATPTGAVNRAINLKLAEMVSVKDFGAIGDGTTDDTTAIAAAITYIGSLNGGDIYFPQGTYKISTPLVLANSQNLVGDTNGTTIYNSSTTQETITAGTNPIIFNGNKSYITGINFTGNPAGANTCHGINIQGMQAIVRDCTFNGLKGSGIKGTYCQYTRINNCGFSDNGRYGIEILNGDPNSLSNDIHIYDIYQNINNGLGGIYFQGNQSLIENCTFTASDIAKTTAAQLVMEGYNNLVLRSTFELESGVGGQLSVSTVTTSGLSNTFSNCIFQSSQTNRAVVIGAGSSKVIFRENCFNYIAATTSGAGYIVKIDAATEVVLVNNQFTNPYYSNFVGGGNPMVGSVAGPYNIYVQDSLKSRRNGLVTTGGAGPYFFTYNMFNLPHYGYFRVMMIAGGNGDNYQNHRGVRTAYIYWYPSSTNINYYNNDGGYQGVGNETNLEIAAVSSTGVVSMVAENSFNGTQSFTIYVTQLASTE